MTRRVFITQEQLEVLEYLLADYDMITEAILEQWELSSIDEMPKAKFIVAFQKILALRELYKTHDLKANNPPNILLPKKRDYRDDA